jgi:hypothetical protein
MVSRLAKSGANADATLASASTASVPLSSMRRSIRLVSHAVSGDPMHSTIAPKVISSPAPRTVTSSPDDNSGNIAAGANTEVPVTMFPNINAVGAKRR